MINDTRVRTLRPHENSYGEQRSKAKGDQYLLPASVARSLAGLGLVAIAADAAPPAKPRRRRARKG